MVAKIFEDFESPYKNFLATRLFMVDTGNIRKTVNFTYSYSENIYRIVSVKNRFLKIKIFKIAKELLLS